MKKYSVCHYSSFSAVFLPFLLNQFDKTMVLSNPRDSRPLKHLIREMRRHDLTNILTMKFFDNFWQFFYIWLFEILIIGDNCEIWTIINFRQLDQFLQLFCLEIIHPNRKLFIGNLTFQIFKNYCGRFEYMFFLVRQWNGHEFHMKLIYSRPVVTQVHFNNEIYTF